MWIITELGSTIRESDLVGVLHEARRRRGKNAPEAESESLRNEEDPTAEFDWTTCLLRVLTAMSPGSFERLAQRLLREAGFLKVEVTGKSGDGGIDGVGVVRIQGLLSFHVHFQCKRYKGTVGSSAIRDFRGAMVGRSDKGLFITTGTFTADAKQEATRDGAPPIDLIDGERLCQLLKEHKLGVQTRLVEEVTVEPSWFDRL
jgi:restriction system protein